MNRKSLVNVQTFINEHPVGRFQRLVFFMCFLVSLLDGFDTAAIGFIAPSLLFEWHISKPELGPVLSAALLGLGFGAFIAGPLSDRLGRRYILIGAASVFGGACLASALCDSLYQLTVLRFVTGIGIGAAMTTTVTIMSEFCPDSRRAMLINLMACGFPVGAALGGFLAAWLIPHIGWRGVLVFGGVMPLAMAILLAVKMPESVRFMVASSEPHRRIQRTLANISSDAYLADHFVLAEHGPLTGNKGFAVVLSKSYIVGSVMLWSAYFMGLVVFYASINWMPILFKEAGFTLKSAALISALFPLGGVGALLSGMLMDRLNANRVVATCYALTAATVYAIGQAVGNLGALVLAIVLAGILMNTAQVSMAALAASFYPTEGRGTGVACMLGIGRLGGIAGSLLIAEMTRRHYGFEDVFTAMAIAGAISCCCLLIKQLSTPGSRRIYPKAEAREH